MSTLEKFWKTVEEHGDIITTKQANEVGVRNDTIQRLVKKGQLEKVTHGIYMHPNGWNDDMYIIQLRSPKLIFSHDTALYLHDLTDRDPISYSVTFPAGYNTSIIKKTRYEWYMAPIDTFTVKPELHQQNIIEITNNWGHTIRTYDVHRTIVDVFRSRKRQDPYAVKDAIQRYFKRDDWDVVKLMNIAKQFRIEKTLRNKIDYVFSEWGI